MKIQYSTVEKMMITDIENLDPVAIIAENIGPTQGKITITCFGKSWTGYWSDMGMRTVKEFFLSCDNDYLMSCIAPNINSDVFDSDALKDFAENRGIDSWRDDLWNDHSAMAELFGDDMTGWSDAVPKMPNPDYQYACRILDAVKEAFKSDK